MLVDHFPEDFWQRSRRMIPEGCIEVFDRLAEVFFGSVKVTIVSSKTAFYCQYPGVSQIDVSQKQKTFQSFFIIFLVQEYFYLRTDQIQ